LRILKKKVASKQLQQLQVFSDDSNRVFGKSPHIDLLHHPSLVMLRTQQLSLSVFGAVQEILRQVSTCDKCTFSGKGETFISAG
jgi:hypothetical protein